MTSPLFSLHNKVAIVAGGMGKFGWEASLALNKAGARVYILGRSKALNPKQNEILEDLNMIYLSCDCSVPDSVSGAIGYCSDVPSIFVNATSSRKPVALASSSIESWETAVSENSRILYSTNLAMAKVMAKEGRGSIINYSSIYAINGADNRIYEGTDMATEPDYSFIKGGVIAFTRYMATQYGRNNVRFNSIVAGGLEGNQPQSFKRHYSEKVPLNRMMGSEDIGGPIVFLASDASRYVTGSALYVDGGYSIL
jgi:NAD(P)-dependent dehydrogenase (short-subunit alcohol dehydrogenase family)